VPDLKTQLLPPLVDPPHIFSVDVEDYFQVSAFERVVDRADWDSYPSRVERNTEVLLDLLARHGAHGTFFTLGWVARRFPELVRRISGAGHEVASHGFWHRRIPTLTREQFREDVREAKRTLEDACGEAVLGFRAPTFSILPGLEWAFDVCSRRATVTTPACFLSGVREVMATPGLPWCPTSSSGTPAVCLSCR
jgi:polysaccharide deacetylase family protein (PEP-CTERM system associated)